MKIILDGRSLIALASVEFWLNEKSPTRPITSMPNARGPVAMEHLFQLERTSTRDSPVGYSKKLQCSQKEASSPVAGERCIRWANRFSVVGCCSASRMMRMEACGYKYERVQ